MLDQMQGSSTFSYRLEYSGQVKMQALGNFTFSSSSYQGTLDPIADSGMNIHSDINPRCIGECKC